MPSTAPIQPRSVYVAVYSDISGWGGGLTFAYALAEAVQQAGHTTRVLGIRSGPSDRAGFPPHADALNLHVRVPARFWRWSHWLAPPALCRALRNVPPPETAFVAVSPFWAIAAKRAWPHVPVYFLYPCLLTNCLPFTWPQRRPAKLWARLDLQAIRRAERRAFEISDVTFVPTQESVDEIGAFAPHAVGRLMRINYGVRRVHLTSEAGVQTRLAIGLAREDFLVAASGTCDRNKGFDLAVRALVHTPDGVHLAVIGDGPERGNLARLAHDLHLSARVHFPGVQRSMLAWYSAANCVISTSFYDTFPNAILEGLAAARAVLVPEHEPPQVYSGLAGLVRQARAGQCYRRAVRPLAEALNALVRDPQASAAMGRRGQAFVTEHCKWEHCAARVLDGVHCRAIKGACSTVRYGDR